jgi:HK97 family phage major capsid protein
MPAIERAFSFVRFPMKKSIAEQISAIEATLSEKQDALSTVIEKSVDEGRSMSAEEREEHDTLESEMKNLGEDLKRLKRYEATVKASARSVQSEADDNATRKAADVRPINTVQVKHTEKVEPGIGFARVAKCLALSHIHHKAPEQIAQSLYPSDEKLVSTLTKGDISAASTLAPTWAGNLINDRGAMFADFVEWLRPRTLLGQISDRLRRIPFDTPVLIQGSGASAAWVKEGKAKPLTQWTYTRVKLEPLKVAAIAAITKELLMRATPVADALIRDELGRAVGARIDTTFISDDSGAADESPDGILEGVQQLSLSGGTTVADIRCDIATFLTAFGEANLSLAGAFWVMPERVAIALSLVANEVGAQAFPGITPSGGTFAGLPVFVTSYADTDSNGSVVALIKGDEIFLGDEDGIQVSMSDQASLIMTDTAHQSTNHTSTGPNPSTVVSMFQTNSVAILVERFINFQRRRDEAVAWARVNWSACTGS